MHTHSTPRSSAGYKRSICLYLLFTTYPPDVRYREVRSTRRLLVGSLEEHNEYLRLVQFSLILFLRSLKRKKARRTHAASANRSTKRLIGSFCSKNERTTPSFFSFSCSVLICSLKRKHGGHVRKVRSTKRLVGSFEEHNEQHRLLQFFIYCVFPLLETKHSGLMRSTSLRGTWCTWSNCARRGAAIVQYCT